MDHRQESIVPPSDRTFNWIFNREGMGNNQTYDRQRASDTYLQWLKDGSIYWVNGKAGSGKSTLMSYLVEHQETRAALAGWAGQHQLRLLSFFFWRAGSHLRRNTTGLLRTILHQLLSSSADLCDNVRSFSSMPPNPTWTEAALRRNLQYAFGQLTDARIRLFLDGLDEFEGDCNALLELLLTLQKLGTVKMCLSSRPEPAIVARLSGLPGMCLSTLNGEDIRVFAEERLAVCEIPLTRFAVEICTRAEGVFLWAVLVTRSLVDGSQSGDSITDLAKRLLFCPRELEDLWEHLLASVHDAHMESLAFYLHVLKLGPRLGNDKTTLAWVAASSLEAPEQSLEDFVTSGHNLVKQIPFRSKGLLEIQPNSQGIGSGLRRSYHCPDGSWERVNTDDTVMASAVGIYYSEIKWAHRSAFDFIMKSGSSNALRRVNNVALDAKFHQRSFDGLLWIATHLPTQYPCDGSPDVLEHLVLVRKYLENAMRPDMDIVLPQSPRRALSAICQNRQA